MVVAHILGNPVRDWVAAAAIATGAFFILLLIQLLVVRRLGAAAAKTETAVDDFFVEIVLRTRRFLLLVIVISLASHSLTWTGRAATILRTVAILAFLMCREMNAASDALLIGTWAVLNGMAEVASGVALRRELAGEWPLPAAGAVSLAVGVLLLVRVHTGAMAIAWLMGIYFIVAGCAFMILGAHLRRLAPVIAERARSGIPGR